MIPRTLSAHLERIALQFPVVTVTGPRQSGKTTLCRAVFKAKPYVSLERPDQRQFATEDPQGFLNTYPDGAVLDEIQRVPELTSWLQPLVDEDPRPGRFILTGSENLTLTQSTSQSLAGRSSMDRLLPLAYDELTQGNAASEDLLETIWTGGYPAIFDRRIAAGDWLAAYTQTFVERDVRLLLNVGDLSTFQTFLGLCAGRTASILNLSSLARDCGVSHNTVRSWLSVLEACHIVFRLNPWHVNVSKRLVKSPKLHFWDTGLVCYLLGILSPEHLRNHPLRGALFETWVVSETHKWFMHRGLSPQCWHYRDQQQLEADLLVQTRRGLVPIEIKSGATVPREPFEALRKVSSVLTGANQSLSRPLVIFGGNDGQRRTHGEIQPWKRLHEALDEAMR